MSKVLVIIPTHSNTETLPFAIESALNQKYPDFEILVIGDGANDEIVSLSLKFESENSRIRFQEYPKSERRGEEYRHRAILDTDAEYVTYLADDDLFLADHLYYMTSEIQGFDFVNPNPTFIDRDDNIWCMNTDLSLESNLRWHLRPFPRRNSVSLSGVLHTKSSYLRLREGWATTPKGTWTDHHMWRKFMADSTMDLKTTNRCTVLKFLGGSNEFDAQKIEQVSRWSFDLTEPEFQAQWNNLVQQTHQKQAAIDFVRRWPWSPKP